MGRVFWLNLVFSVLELLGGLYTGSVALIADALHDFGDALVIAMAYFFEMKAENGPDTKFSYGYKRYSLLSALITGLVLFGGSLAVIVYAVTRFSVPEEIKTLPMIGFAFVGLAVNGLSFLQLRGATKQNAQMIRWHLLEDTLGWASVLVGSVIMHFTNWLWIDSLLAVAISTWILIGVGRSLWSTVQVFLQKVPSGLDLSAIKNQISAIVGVKEVHDLHLWSLDGTSHVLSMHVIRTSSTIEPAQLKKSIRESVAHWGEVHATIEVEDPDEHCGDQC